MKSILLTRPLLDSLGTRDALKKCGHKVYVEPLFTVKYLHADLSLFEFDIVISTSKNSVKGFSNAYKGSDIPIIAVGSSTMQAARDLGFTDIVSADGDVESLISFIKAHYSKELKFLYIRGQEVSCDLKKKLSDKHFNVVEVILYKTIVKRGLTNRCKNLLLAEKVNGVIFFSARTARLFCSLVLKGGLSDKMNSMIAYTMSKSIADNLKLIKWKSVVVSRLPTQEGLIDEINRI